MSCEEVLSEFTHMTDLLSWHHPSYANLNWIIGWGHSTNFCLKRQDVNWIVATGSDNMKISSCEAVLQYVPAFSEFADLRSTFVVNLVLNVFLCHAAVALNLLTIHAIRKTWSLPKTLKILLLSLAVSDVGVGLVVHPFYISLLVKWLHYSKPSCFTYKIFFMIMSLFALASFFGVVLLSVDRFMAIQFHLRYREIVTHRRVAAVVITVWVFSASLSLTPAWFPSESSLIIFFVGTICLIFTTLVYCKIFVVLRRHKNQIRGLQLQQAAPNSEVRNLTSLSKSAVNLFYVYVVFMVCYLPRGGSLIGTAILERSTMIKGFLLCSWTLVFLNSSLNPVIYCLKMRHFRHAVRDILRNMRFRRNRSQSERRTFSDFRGEDVTRFPTGLWTPDSAIEREVQMVKWKSQFIQNRGNFQGEQGAVA